MKIAKYITWFICYLALFLLARIDGFQNGSAYIQFVDGCVLAFGAGVFVGHWKTLKQFLKHHHAMHDMMQRLESRVDELHDKHDELHQKIKRMENKK